MTGGDCRVCGDTVEQLSTDGVCDSCVAETVLA